MALRKSGLHFTQQLWYSLVRLLANNEMSERDLHRRWEHWETLFGVPTLLRCWIFQAIYQILCNMELNRKNEQRRTVGVLLNFSRKIIISNWYYSLLAGSARGSSNSSSREVLGNQICSEARLDSLPFLTFRTAGLKLSC